VPVPLPDPLPVPVLAHMDAADDDLAGLQLSLSRHRFFTGDSLRTNETLTLPHSLIKYLLMVCTYY